MNKDERIEKVARDIWDRDEKELWGDDTGSIRKWDPDSPDEDLAIAATEWLETVSDVYNALLPEVTTAEELEALPIGQVLIGHRDGQGPVLVRRSNYGLPECAGAVVAGYVYSLEETLKYFVPLTVWHS